MVDLPKRELSVATMRVLKYIVENPDTNASQIRKTLGFSNTPASVKVLSNRGYITSRPGTREGKGTPPTLLTATDEGRRAVELFTFPNEG